MTGLRDQLDAIYTANGALTPLLVVTEAMPEESPLHGRFLWDDQEAGHRYRLVQARELIRSVQISYREEPDGTQVKCRAYVARYADEGYVPTSEVLRDDVGAEIVLREFQRQVQALQRTYGHLEEFRDVIKGELLGETG